VSAPFAAAAREATGRRMLLILEQEGWQMLALLLLPAPQRRS
jgi:hypothetical protein